MKMLKISDQIHAELTKVVGQLIAESRKIKTYEDGIEALLHRSALLPPELLEGIEAFLTKNPHFGYLTREEFLKDAARSKMEQLTRKREVAPRN
jgi:hypothetical protein